MLGAERERKRVKKKHFGDSVAVDESVDFSMAASSGSKMKLGMMKRKIKKKKVQTATGDRKWIKRMFFFVVARSPPATLRVRASSVRVSGRRGGRRGSNLSKFSSVTGPFFAASRVSIALEK